MSVSIRVPEEFRETIEKFAAVGGSRVKVVAEGEADLNVEPSPERRECTSRTLYPNGWVVCATALSIAHRLNLGPREVGRLMNGLDIKIKKCSLGCFG